jgi:hypothetical protein
VKRLIWPAMLVVFLLGFSSVSAFSARNRIDQFVQGTVLGVNGETVQSPEYPTGGSNPSDAPLTTSYYEYHVSLQVGCMIYTGRYLTPFHYLPSMFTSGHSVGFRLTKRVMYFDVPDTAGIRMSIIRRKAADCPANR